MLCSTCVLFSRAILQSILQTDNANSNATDMILQKTKIMGFTDCTVIIVTLKLNAMQCTVVLAISDGEDLDISSD